MPDPSQDLLTRTPDILMPSAEGATGYPRDLLELSVEDLKELMGGNGGGNGNGGHSDPENAVPPARDPEAGQ
jgi:hypothetical protein